MTDQSIQNSTIKSKAIQESLPSVISFFTGGGFLDMGFKKAGFNVVWTNEVNPAFADMYEYGMTAWQKHTTGNESEVKITTRKNIERLISSEIIAEAFGKKVSGKIGIIGGPPCPDFSSGGKNKGHKGPNGRLSKVYIKHICAIKPDFFVFENVPGLYKTRIHRAFLKRIEKKLESKGYRLDLKILNSLELGVPQDRERLIMIGMKPELIRGCLEKDIQPHERGWFQWPIIDKYQNARSKYDWPETSSFGGNPKKPSDIPFELMVDSVLNSDTYPEKKVNGRDMFKPYSKRFSTIKEGDTKRKSFKRLHRYRFSPTVCYGHNEVHLHPWEKRRLSVREAMRIQGIPDEYVLPAKNSLSEKFAMISNGVPVPLAYHLAISIKNFLTSSRSRQNK